MKPKISILHVEDSIFDQQLIKDTLLKENQGFEVVVADNREKFENLLGDGDFDLVLSDFNILGFDGLQVIQIVKEKRPDLPVIIVTGTGSEEIAIQAMKMGAADYVIKSVRHIQGLVPTINTVLEHKRILAEHRKTEEIIRHERMLLRILVNNLPDAIYVKDKDGRKLIANYSDLQIMNCTSEEEIIGKTDLEIFDTETGARGYAEDMSVLKTGQPLLNQTDCYTDREGKQHWRLTSKIPLFDDQGQITGLVGIGHDFTERKKDEDALRESYEFSNTLLQTIPFGMDIIDEEGNILFQNEKLRNIYGPGAIGRKCWELYRDDNKRCKNCPLLKGEKIIRTGTYISHGIFGGRTYEISYTGTVFQDKNAFLQIFQDITERKQAEDKLKSSEERLKILFDYAPDAYYLNDLKGNLLDGNVAAEKLMGYKRNELIGKSFLKLDILSLDQVPRAAQLLVKNSFGKGTGPDEFVLTRKNGTKVAVEIITHPVKIKDKTQVLGLARDITERKRVLEELAFNHTILQTQQEVSIDGILVVDEAGKIISVNNRFIEMWGIPHKVAESRSDKRFLDTVISRLIDPEGFMNKVNYLYGHKDEKSRDEISLSDGRIFDRYSAPMTMPDGRYLGRVWYFRDVTKRRRAEESLRNSETRFRSYFESSLAGIAITSAATGWVQVNERLCEMLGYSADELLKTTWPELTHPDDLDIDLEHFEQVLEGVKDGYTIDKRFIRKDGKIIWTSLGVSCVRLTDGNVDYFIAVLFDITERKRAEQALQESEEKFRSIMENSPDAIFIADKNARFLYTNKAVTEMLGFSREEMTNKTISDIAPKGRINEYYELFKRSLLEGKVYAEIELLKKDGTFIETDLNSVNLPGGLVYASCRDITQRKQAEKELIRSKEKAEESDRLKTAFLNNISHEIRTPLNAIVGFSTLLGESDMNNEKRKAFTDTIIESSDHLLAIVSDIIEISNIEAGILSFHKSEIKLNAFLNSLFEQFNTNAASKGIQFSVNYSHPDEETIIETDRAKLVQILSNLLSNALKFTDQGRINIGYTLGEDYLIFKVSDTGIGIPEDQHKRIFDRFYQIRHTGKRLYEGTGLGLSISKALAEFLGGRLWLESKPGKGSDFYFSLPYSRSETAKPAKPETLRDGEVEFTRPATILVAEDDDNNFELIARYLSDPRLILIRARNGTEAVRLCETKKGFDLVLMDLKMPEMDGYEATERIKKLCPGLTVIAQSAFVTDTERVFKSGCTEMITKPFNRKDLTAIVRKYLASD
jgi:PAS domain S-box-containing protein